MNFHRQYRIILKAVISLVFNLIFAFYNGILGILSRSAIFGISAVYYLLLSGMGFLAVILGGDKRRKRKVVIGVGMMLMALSLVFQAMVIISFKYQTPVSYGTVPMIAIATFTFFKVTTAIITAVRYRKVKAPVIKAINSIRYSQVAVSLLTMQQSMLVSFGDMELEKAFLLNSLTGCSVFTLILILGIITLKNGKEIKNGKIKNCKGK